jgi:hypothetical protein
LNPLLGDLVTMANPVALARATGMLPDKWQTDVLRTDASRILILASRQIGKSTVASIMAMHVALYAPRSLVLLVSPSLKQSQELFRSCLTLYRTLGRPVDASSESALTLELENRSRLVALPGAESTIRGYASAALVIIDEAARVPDELYHSVRPMLAVSAGRLVCMSTPAGRRGWFYDSWENGTDWLKVKILASQCPRISPRFLEEERRSLGSAMFAQEYEAVFGDTENAVFLSEVVESAFDPSIKPLFAKES